MMKLRNTFVVMLLAAMVIGGSFLANSHTVNAAEKKQYVQKSDLPVLTAPSDDAQQVGTLKKGKKITVYGTEGKYTKVKFTYDKAQLASVDVTTEEATTEAADTTTEATEDEYCYVPTKYLADTKVTGKEIVRFAKTRVGKTPYHYGGTSLKKGTDCSGFVFAIYKKYGYKIGRSGYDQRYTGKKVSWSKKKPGDIIVYGGGDHVGIYIGGNKIVHASNEQDGVKISYPANYRSVTCVRRVIY